MTSLKKATLLASQELGVPLELVEKIYRAYWLSIRDSIQKLPLKGEVTEESLEDSRLSFNIPSLGKLYTSYDRIKGVKRRFEYLQKIRENDYNKKT